MVKEACAEVGAGVHEVVDRRREGMQVDLVAAAHHLLRWRLARPDLGEIGACRVRWKYSRATVRDVEPISSAQRAWLAKRFVTSGPGGGPPSAVRTRSQMTMGYFCSRSSAVTSAVTFLRGGDLLLHAQDAVRVARAYSAR